MGLFRVLNLHQHQPLITKQSCTTRHGHAPRNRLQCTTACLVTKRARNTYFGPIGSDQADQEASHSDSLHPIRAAARPDRPVPNHICPSEPRLKLEHRAHRLCQQMPEIWDYLARAKRQKALCASDVEAIKESCRQNHNHRHVIECVECYGKVLERMHDRYIASPDAECFLVQATFPKEMGDLFAQARERRSALREIEERATKGRQARIVQIVKGSQVIRHLLRDSGQVHLLPKMDSGNVALSTVLGEIRNSLGHVPAPSEDVDHCLVQLTGAEALPAEETLQVMHKIFFSDYKDSSAKGSQEELERLRNGSSLDVVMEHRLERSLANKASKDLKEKHRRRLDELRRAQSAHEAAKSRKTKDRKATAPPQTPAPSLEVPPCTTCHGAVDSKSFFSCPLCQIRAGLDDRWHPAVYCSGACYHEAFVSSPSFLPTSHTHLYIRASADRELRAQELSSQ